MAVDAKFDASLSYQARSLWGKSDYGMGECWLPLYVHMADSAGVASRLWDSWVPRSTKAIVARALDGEEALARSLFVFLAGVHDIGKATPAFQVKGLPFGRGGEGGILWKPEHAGLVIRHDPIAGEVLLTKYLKEHCFTGEVQGRQARRRAKKQASAISCIVGAHHGRFPSTTRLVPAGEDGIALGWGGEGSADWIRVQGELISFALHLADLSESDVPRLANHHLTVATESILTGLVIMTEKTKAVVLISKLGAPGHGMPPLSCPLGRSRVQTFCPLTSSLPRGSNFLRVPNRGLFRWRLLAWPGRWMSPESW